jgi:hypothetical protein
LIVNLPRVKSLAIKAACMLFSGCLANNASAQSIVVAMPPGGSAAFDVLVSNPTSAAVIAPGFSSGPNHLFVETSLSSEPPCAISGTPKSFVLVAPDLAANSAVTCRIQLTRSSADLIPTATLNLFPEVPGHGATLNPSRWTVGVTADMALTVEQVPPLPQSGGTEAFFRVTASNPSTHSISHADIGGCAFIGTPRFMIDSDFPGGCPAANFGSLCFTGSYGLDFGLPTVPANGEATCLIRATRAAGLVAGDSWDFDVIYPGHSDNGYFVGDPTITNNDGSFRIAFSPMAIPATGLLSLLLLSGLLGLFADRAHRVRVREAATRSVR